MPEFIFSPFFQNKDGKNAIETGLMCSLAVVAILLLCITRWIVFKETKLVAWCPERGIDEGQAHKRWTVFEKQPPFPQPFVSARQARFF